MRYCDDESDEYERIQKKTMMQIDENYDPTNHHWIEQYNYHYLIHKWMRSLQKK